MPKFVHTISTMTSATDFGSQDHIRMGLKLAVANAAGSGAGAAVTVAITGNFPSTYAVLVQPGQDATWWITSKTSAGFTVNLAPRLAASTLASGTIDIMLIG